MMLLLRVQGQRGGGNGGGGAKWQVHPSWRVSPEGETQHRGGPHTSAHLNATKNGDSAGRKKKYQQIPWYASVTLPPSPRVPLPPTPSSSASFSSPSFRPSLLFRPLSPSSFVSCVCFLIFFPFHLFRSPRTCTAVKCVKLVMFFALLFFFVKLKIVCKASDACLKRRVKTCPSFPSRRRLFGRPRWQLWRKGGGQQGERLRPWQRANTSAHIGKRTHAALLSMPVNTEIVAFYCRSRRVFAGRQAAFTEWRSEIRSDVPSNSTACTWTSQIQSITLVLAITCFGRAHFPHK